MAKIETIIDLIKNNAIFSDDEKSFWLKILPNFDETEQDEFYKILSQGSNEYANLKNNQTNK
jgi:hypothetical protein